MSEILGVWIDSDLCTGDGICAEIAPDVFEAGNDGLYHVTESGNQFADPDPKFLDQVSGEHLGSNGVARIPETLLDAVIEAAEACPGECIFINN